MIKVIVLLLMFVSSPSFARTVCALMSVGLSCGDMYNSVNVFNGKHGVANMSIDIDPQTCRQLLSTGMNVYCVNVERAKQCLFTPGSCGYHWVPTSQFAIDEARSTEEHAKLDADRRAKCKRDPYGFSCF